MTTEIKLTKVVPINKKENYEEALKRHLTEVSDDIKELEPEVLFVACLCKDGLIYQSMTNNNALELLGALEIVKTYIVGESLED